VGGGGNSHSYTTSKAHVVGNRSYVLAWPDYHCVLNSQINLRAVSG
jgi:hypothetical protein